MDLNRKTIRAQFEKLESLPPLPQMAQKILQLRSSPNPNIKSLAKIIELDPSLSAQVIRYAKSSLYGYQGKISNAESAISRVLGYDTVLNLALSLASTHPFTIPRKGPLGAEAFWQRAVKSAVMSQKLSPCIPKERNITTSMAYLAGLLHEIGLLAIAHVQPKLFKELNHNHDQSLVERERELLAITHAEAGARLMKHWQLPDEIIITNLKCASPKFTGIHADYALLVFLSNTLNNNSNQTPEEIIKDHPDCNRIISFLNMDKANVVTIFNQVHNSLADVDSMARLLAA